MSRGPGSYRTENRYSSSSRRLRASSRKETKYDFPVTITKVMSKEERAKARIEQAWKKWEEE